MPPRPNVNNMGILVAVLVGLGVVLDVTVGQGLLRRNPMVLVAMLAIIIVGIGIWRL